MKMKVLVSDNLSPRGIKILEQEPGIEVAVKTGLSEEQLTACIGQYEALLIRSATKVTAGIIEAGEKLRLVGRAGVGVDNVDIAAASRKGVVVMNAPGGNTITTAEHTLSLLTALARNIPEADASLRKGCWDRKRYQGVELCGKVLGIVGLGRIGREIASRAQGMGMQVVAHDPMLSQEEVSLGVRLLPLLELYAVADFITVHSPLNEQTRHLINQQALGKMKRGVRILNCARGGIIDEEALYAALKSGQVAGAALDVFEQEPPAPDNPLLGLEQVICTPHLGASTAEAQEKVALDIAHQAVAFLKQGIIINAVNIPTLPAETQTILEPYLELGQKLGYLLGQLTGPSGEVQEFKVGLGGELLQQHAQVIDNTLLVGVMKGLRPNSRVNQVNARLLAEELGIALAPPRPQREGDYTNWISLQLATKDGLKSVAATLLSGKLPRVIMLNGFKVEFEPSGYILILFNKDRPGIIGNIGTALGKEGINIAGMQFGRRRLGGEAISIFRVDSALPAELLPQLEQLPHIHSVQQVYL